MKKVKIINCTLEVPDAWDLPDVRQFLQRQIISTASEERSLIIDWYGFGDAKKDIHQS